MPEWRDFPWRDRLYQVSDDGQVRDAGTGRVLTLTKGNTGYLYANMSCGGARKCQTVHSMVAHCFLGPRPAGQQVRHLDGCRTNNGVGNLAYGTAADNSRDAKIHGTIVRGEGSGNAKLTERGVLAIRRLKGLVPLHVLAKALGVSKSIISQATLSTWQHVSGEISTEDALMAVFGTTGDLIGKDAYATASTHFSTYKNGGR